MTTVDADRQGDTGRQAEPGSPLHEIGAAVDATAANPPGLVAVGARYWAALRAERKLAVAAIVLASISGSLEGIALLMLVPLLSQTGVAGSDGGPFSRLLRSLGFHDRGLVWAALTAFALMALVAAVSRFAADTTTSLVRARAEARLRKQLTERLLGMEWSSFLMLRFGEMANSLLWESSQLGAGIQFFLTAVGAIVVTIVYAALALLLSLRLTLVVVGFALLGILVLRPMGKRVERYAQGWTTAATGIAYRVADIFGNLKFFRSTGSRRRAQQLFDDGYDEYAAWFQRSQVSPFAVRLSYELAAVAVVVLLLGIALVGKSTLSASTLVFLAIFMRLSPRVRDLQASMVQVRVQFPWLTTWEKRGESAAAHQVRRHGSAAPAYDEMLRAEGVTFAFPGAERPVLDDVSWELRPGEAVAFVGESGAGKTTMLDLVSGLLVPTSGRISLDGVSLSEIDLDGWQSHIGLVLQESPLFHGSVRENVVGDGTPDDALVWECLRSAHAAGFVERLPDGLETVIGERGGRLSGGERQRLGLARALYRRPWLLVLDEATSALDSVGEQVVLDALRELHGRVSMLIVAHRLATVEIADVIHVLAGGRIVQSGTWSELLTDNGGPFARMAAKQGLLATTTP